VQKPLPICIGGKGKKRTLPIAARYAHHWNYSGSDPAEFAACREILHRSCDAIGRDVAEITCSTLLRFNGDSAALRRDADAFTAVGAQLGIVSVPKTEPASVVTGIARMLG
jgi:alkanesulfonate monooxygenase SsuD/methylene tetrahydromethanopterin reductase-like flavin-dependent oxidoreductase (luciferase family)